MTRRFREVWIGVLCGALLVGGLYAVLRFVGASRWPGDAVVVPRDVSTLAEALDRAWEGATIVLQRRPDAYAGPITLDVRGVTLVGADSGVTIAAAGSEPAITVSSDGVSVTNLTVRSESVGVRVAAAECFLRDLSVDSTPVGIQLLGSRRCTLQGIEVGGGRVGIELVSSSGCRLEAVAIRGASEAGLRLLQSVENVVDDLLTRDVQTGVSVEETSSGNLLLRCDVARSSEAGIAIRASSGNELVESRVAEAQVGVALEAVTENVVRRCVVEDSVSAGISLRQAAQNRIAETRVGGSAGDGILLSQSGENAIFSNGISGCEGDGIGLDSSDRNLIAGNRLAGNRNGIVTAQSNENRFLRNTVERSESVGVSLTGGRANRLLDNEILGGSIGVALNGAEESVLLRNRFERQPVGGIVLLSGTRVTRVEENAVRAGGFGVLAAGGSRESILGNHLAENGIGLYLIGPGAGIRIVGNRLEANGAGLVYAEGDEDLAGLLLPLGLEVGAPVADLIPPVIANNSFHGNSDVDVANRTDRPLYAAGNWWIDRQGPVTEGRVLLEESSWKGTLAVGAGRGEERVILGRILEFALEAAGYRVIDLVGLGNEERVADALRAHDVDAVWWGVRVGTDAAPGGSDVQVVPTLVREGWVAIASPALAERLAASTLSALSDFVRAANQTIRFAAPGAFGREVFTRLLATYRLDSTAAGVTWTRTPSEAEAMLKFGAADVVLVGNLGETLTLSGYPSLADDSSGLPSSPLELVLREEVLARHPEIEPLLSALAARLTTEILHDLTSRVRLLGELPEEVARGFLRATPLRE